MRNNNKSKIIIIIIILLIGSFVFAQSSGRAKSRSSVKNYSLQVNSNVRGASISVVGKDGAKTSRFSQNTSDSVNINSKVPFKQTLKQGEYTITVSAPGYHTETRNINLTSNQNLTINLRLITAKVIITIPPTILNPKISNPAAQIKIYDNGELLGKGNIFELTPGQHTIQIVSGGIMLQGTFRLQAGKSYTIEPSIDLKIK